MSDGTTKVALTLHLACGHTRSDEVNPRSAMAAGLVDEAPCQSGCGVQRIDRTERGVSG